MSKGKVPDGQVPDELLNNKINKMKGKNVKN